MIRHFASRYLLFPLMLGSCLHADALLDFGEGNFIRGKALELRDGNWLWQHGISGSEMELPANKVKRILFSADTAPNPAGDILLLDNGDILAGSIQSLDETDLTIVSPVLGEMKLERKRLRTARLAPRLGSLVFKDEGDVKGWILADKNAGEEWTSANGVLRYHGKGNRQTLARDVKLPPSADISFEMTWDNEKEEEVGFAAFSLVLAASDAEGTGGKGCYKLQFARSWVTVEREHGEGAGRSSNTLRRFPLQKLPDVGPTVRVRVVLDRPRKKIHVFLNGRAIGEVSDDFNDELPGTWLGIQTGGAGNFRVRRLQVESWNGFLGNKLATTAKSSTTRDLVITAPDGDEIFGKINSIREEPERGRVVEIAVAVNQSKPLVIPVSRIAHLSFANTGEAAPVAENAATLLLDDGSKVAITPVGLDEKVLRADFNGRQGAEIPLERVLSLEFARANSKQAAEQNQNPPEPEE